MFHVYLLRSVKKYGSTYVGFTTKNVLERLAEHNHSLTTTTAPHSPWKIEVVVSFVNKKKAEEFEKYLKHGSGHAFARTLSNG